MVGDPPFFFGRPLPLPFPDRLRKNGQQISLGRGKKSSFSVHAALNFGIRGDVRGVEMWPLNDKISSQNISSSLNFLLKSTSNNWRIKFQFGDLFINFWHKLALYPCALSRSFCFVFAQPTDPFHERKGMAI